MPGAHRNLQFGPGTYAVTEAVKGGQLVMADTGTPGKVKVAGAGSLIVLGVALHDAGPVVADADPLITAAAQPEVAVQYGPADVDVLYTGATALGTLLIAGAAGTVTPYTAGVDTFDKVVGRATETVSGAVVGRVRLFG